MIKRLLIGTFVALVLAVLSAGIFVGYSLYQIQGLVNEVDEAEDAFRRTNADFAYDGLSTETLRLDRLAAFRRVRQDIGRRLGEGAQDMLEDLARKERRARQGERVGILAIMGTLRDHFRAQRSMTTEMVRELRRERMSAREYRDWTLLLFETVRARHASDPACRELWGHYEAADGFLQLFTSGLSPRRARQQSLLDVGPREQDGTDGDGGDQGATGGGDTLEPASGGGAPSLLTRPAELGASPDLLTAEVLAEFAAELRDAPMLRAPQSPSTAGDAPAAEEEPAPRDPSLDIASWALLDLIVVEAEAGVMSASPHQREP